MKIRFAAKTDVGMTPTTRTTSRWPGRSRAYRVRGSRIEQLAHDHSLLEDYKLARPHIAAEEIEAFPHEPAASIAQWPSSSTPPTETEASTMSRHSP